jgi:hypothetical protein
MGILARPTATAAMKEALMILAPMEGSIKMNLTNPTKNPPPNMKTRARLGELNNMPNPKAARPHQNALNKTGNNALRSNITEDF